MTNTLAKLSGRPGLVSLGLCTVAGTALLLGTALGLMLADLAPAPEPLVVFAASEPAPPAAATAGHEPITAGASLAPPPQAAASAAAPAGVPATASIVGPTTALATPPGMAPRPPLNGLPLDLGPRVDHALAALAPAGFEVQAGTFASERHATSLAAALADIAAPVRVTPVVQGDGQSGWLVAAGPFADAATATATAADIRRTVGVDPLIRTLEPGE